MGRRRGEITVKLRVTNYGFSEELEYLFVTLGLSWVIITPVAIKLQYYFIVTV